MAADNITVSVTPSEPGDGALEAVQKNLDDFFITIISIIIFLMQAGFAFLEAGAVRSKNATNILLKNMLDSFIACLSYWALGYAFAFGQGDSFIGASGFFGTYPASETSRWFFQMVFAATAATIVSGGVAERCEFTAYFAYSIILTAFCYPVVARWGWHDKSSTELPNNVGWLIDGVSIIPGAKYQDFAGSGMVHLCGGTAALFGAAFLGPRIGRFNDQGKTQTLPGHSVPMAALGGFILMLGFFAFNGGSQVSISKPGDGLAVTTAVVNTMISGCTSGITTIILHRIIISASRNCFFHSTWSLLATINGVLAGMVAICAGADKMASWGAFLTGAIASLIYYAVSTAMLKLKIDDPLDAVAVHAGGGTWGLVAAPLFDAMDGIVVTGSKKSFETLAMNLIGWLAIVGWASVICVPMFSILKATKFLRVTPEIEIKGLDVPKHAEPAYPVEAWGDGWGNLLVCTSNNGLATPASGAQSTAVEMSNKNTNSEVNGKDNHGADLP